MAEAAKDDQEQAKGYVDAVKVRSSQINRETWWLNYCVCGGCGCHKDFCNPFYMKREKFLCFETFQKTTDWWTKEQGLCMQVQKICCLLTIAAFPPGGASNDGIPLCALCNTRWGGEKKTDDETDRTELKKIVDEAFICFHILCYGCGVATKGDICHIEDKFCCCYRMCQTAHPFTDEGCCYKTEKLCWCNDNCVCPPGGMKDSDLPMIACCGKVLVAGSSNQVAAVEGQGAPQQEIMQ